MPRKPNPPKPEASASTLTGPQPVMSEKVISYKKKKQPKKSMAIVRRSARLLSVVKPSPFAVKDIVMEPIPILESEDEEDQYASPDKSEKSPAPDNLEEDMNPVGAPDNLEECINPMDCETVNEQFKSKATKPSCPNRNRSADFSYKNLYINSLKKVEALKEDNAALAKKLDFALGKIEAYEGLKDTMMHLKDIVLVSGLGRATEAAINMASQGTLGKSSLSGAPNGVVEPETAPNNVTEQSGSRAKKKK